MSDGNHMTVSYTSFVYEAGEAQSPCCNDVVRGASGCQASIEMIDNIYRIDLLEEEDTMPFGPYKQFRKSYIQWIEKEVRNKPINRVQFGKKISWTGSNF